MKILVTGAYGFLGQHLTAKLQALGHTVYPVSSKAYDLRSQAHIDALFNHTGTPGLIYHLAAHVGGIAYNLANPATIYYDNVMMNTLLIDKAAKAGVKKFVFVSSACAYPAHPSIPTSEDELWNGYPEESNGTYGISKRIALAQLEACKQQYGMGYAYPILANLYGPGDEGFFKPERSHLIPNLIKQFMTKQVITIQGGKLTRDFLYVEDAAEALLRFVEIDSEAPLNIATGIEVPKRDLVDLISKVADYQGTIEYKGEDKGQLRRCYDVARAREILGWQAETSLEEGLKRTVKWYSKQ